MQTGDADPEVIGEYVLESRLGAGGMGVVHLARSSSGRRVAVKIVHEQFAQDDDFRARFRQEVTAARRVSGAFTAPVMDADPDAPRPWMATLYVPGPTLAQQVKREGPFPAQELWQFAAGLAEALRDIHRAGLVHRDLKPSNVLLAADGPKVIDFGISRPSDSLLRTETGKLIGTPPFMAPEQFRAPREVGPAADVFALGCLLVHAAVGRGPFDGDSPYLVAYQVVHDEPDLSGVPEALRALVGRCLSKEPEDRPTSRELTAALRDTRPGAAPFTGTGSAEGPPTEPEVAPDPTQHQFEAPGPDGPDGPDPGQVAPRPEEAAPRLPAPRRPRRRTARWAALGAAAAVLLAVGGVLGLRDGTTPASTVAPASPTTAATAAKDWETKVGGTDAEDGGQVLTAECVYGDGALYCAGHGVAAARLDPADGTIVWSRKAADPDSGWLEAPVFSGRLVQTVRIGQTIRALDPATGKPRVTTDISPYGSCCTFAGGSVVLSSRTGLLTALDTSTGKPRWTRQMADGQEPAIRAFGDAVYTARLSQDASSTLVTAIRAESGEVSWKHRLTGNLTPLGVSGGALYLMETPADEFHAPSVVRYDPGTGRITVTPLPYNNMYGDTALLDGRMLYLVNASGRIMAVDTRSTGSDTAPLWELETSVSSPSPATVSGGLLYFSAPDGRLLAVDLAKGQLAGQTEPRFDAARRGLLTEQPAPIVARGRVFAFTPKGTVFSVGVSPRAW